MPHTRALSRPSSDPLASWLEATMTVPHDSDVASPGSRDAIAAWLMPALTLVLQLATYAGMPSVNEALSVYREVLRERGEWPISVK